jgi:polysaccharide deacetylase 2 family uncharacterized protein YibQ
VANTRRKRPRTQFALYSLLGVIAVTLVLLVALLPDEASETPAQTTDQPAEEPAETLPDSVSARGEEDATPDEEPPLPTVTETYPEDEVPDPGLARPDEGEELWWLPDQEYAAGDRGTLVLVLDDAGNNTDYLADYLAFPGPLTLAVLPQLDYSVESAVRAVAAGKEIILHLPMEAVGGMNPGPGAVNTSMSDREILVAVEENLSSVPGAVGVNNHMGSAATADERVMEIVLAEVRRRGLYFLDSRTTAQTVAPRIAAYLDTPFVERDVFLDNERDREAILSSLSVALRLAAEQDTVVMIGHVTDGELASVLAEVYPVLEARGYRFGFLSDAVPQPGAGS